ncbi:hypothetical protein C8R43DRAFT_1122473 [Mycena crocata]|nr:hypothetical protein C8R43DRAFT_1122473 [Mycena crocata]
MASLPNETTTNATQPTLTLWSTARELWVGNLDVDAPGPAAHCGRCKTNFWLETDGGMRFFGCDACSEIFCYVCCIMDHRELPLHLLKEWTGIIWQNVTLADIGFIHQLGHGGLACTSPAKPVDTIRVIRTTGVQSLNYRLCACGANGTRDEQLIAARLHTHSKAATGDLSEMVSRLGLD